MTTTQKDLFSFLATAFFVNLFIFLCYSFCIWDILWFRELPNWESDSRFGFIMIVFMSTMFSGGFWLAHLKQPFKKPNLGKQLMPTEDRTEFNKY